MIEPDNFQTYERFKREQKPAKASDADSKYRLQQIHPSELQTFALGRQAARN